MSIRLPTLTTDRWQLSSAEDLNREHPDTFWIPSLKERTTLSRGQAAKLIFEILVNDNGEPVIQGERIFVIVAEKIGDTYIGILDGQPVSVPEDSGIYLCFGAEIPFRAENVVDVAWPPKNYVDWQLSIPPERKWERDQG